MDQNTVVATSGSGEIVEGLEKFIKIIEFHKKEEYCYVGFELLTNPPKSNHYQKSRPVPSRATRVVRSCGVLRP